MNFKFEVEGGRVRVVPEENGAKILLGGVDFGKTLEDLQFKLQDMKHTLNLQGAILNRLAVFVFPKGEKDGGEMVEFELNGSKHLFLPGVSTEEMEEVASRWDRTYNPDAKSRILHITHIEGNSGEGYITMTEEKGFRICTFKK